MRDTYSLIRHIPLIGSIIGAIVFLILIPLKVLECSRVLAEVKKHMANLQFQEDFMGDVEANFRKIQRTDNEVQRAMREINARIDELNARLASLQSEVDCLREHAGPEAAGDALESGKPEDI
jgi:septal ring factor EnvC (AmiA/AmiB activator)